MKLREYIKEEKINIAILARRAGIPYATAKYAVEGGNITLKNAYKLQLATKGKCKLLDMLPDFSPQDCTDRCPRDPILNRKLPVIYPALGISSANLSDLILSES